MARVLTPWGAGLCPEFRSGPLSAYVPGDQRGERHGRCTGGTVALEGSSLKPEDMCLLIPSNLCCPSPRVFTMPYSRHHSKLWLALWLGQKNQEPGSRVTCQGCIGSWWWQPLGERAGPAFLTSSRIQVKSKPEDLNVGPRCQP